VYRKGARAGEERRAEALAGLDRATRRCDGESFLHDRASPGCDHPRVDPRFRSISGRVAG